MSQSLFDTVLEEYVVMVSSVTPFVAPIYLNGTRNLVQKVQSIVNEITREDEKGVWIIFIRDIIKSLEYFSSPLRAPMDGANKIYESCLKLDSKYHTEFTNIFNRSLSN